MKRFGFKSKLVAGAAVVALGIGVSGAAFAFWSSTGSGSGTASTTAGSSDLTYQQNETLTAMYPGDAAQPFTVTVTNNSLTQNENVANVEMYITTNKAGCTGDDFLLNGSAAHSTAATADALSWTSTELAANGGNATTSGDTIQFNDKPSVDQNACKSATVTLNYVTQ